MNKVCNSSFTVHRITKKGVAGESGLEPEQLAWTPTHGFEDQYRSQRRSSPIKLSIKRFNGRDYLYKE